MFRDDRRHVRRRRSPWTDASTRRRLPTRVESRRGRCPGSRWSSTRRRGIGPNPPCPGPESIASSSTAVARSSRRAATTSSPPPPCLTRLVASSVATRATLPWVSASNSKRGRAPRARHVGPRRPGCASWTMTAVDVMPTARSSRGSRWPGSDSTENSLHSRFDPPSPRPSPPPVVNPSVKRARDVRDSRALVLEDEPQALLRAVEQRHDLDLVPRGRASACCARARWRRSRAWSGRPGGSPA